MPRKNARENEMKDMPIDILPENKVDMLNEIEHVGISIEEQQMYQLWEKRIFLEQLMYMFRPFTR
jgi:hypothetical protein